MLQVGKYFAQCDTHDILIIDIFQKTKLLQEFQHKIFQLHFNFAQCDRHSNEVAESYLIA